MFGNKLNLVPQSIDTKKFIFLLPLLIALLFILLSRDCLQLSQTNLKLQLNSVNMDNA